MKIISKRGRELGLQSQMLTQDQIKELKICAADPVYFINKYVRYQNPVRGNAPFTLTAYNEAQVRALHANPNVVNCSARQSGKSLTAMSYFLWLTQFRQGENYIVIGDGLMMKAFAMFQIFEFALANLPDWMRAEIKLLSPNNVQFENGTRISFRAASSNVFRGVSFSRAYVDEAAYIDPQVMHDMFYSMVPSLSAGGGLLMSSSPSDRNNVFHKVWMDAKHGRSTLFVPFQVTIDDIPALNTMFNKATLRAQLGDDVYRRDFLCEFPTP